VLLLLPLSRLLLSSKQLVPASHNKVAPLWLLLLLLLLDQQHQLPAVLEQSALHLPLPQPQLLLLPSAASSPAAAAGFAA
jgi:hypothetical protein